MWISKPQAEVTYKDDTDGVKANGESLSFRLSRWWYVGVLRALEKNNLKQWVWAHEEAIAVYECSVCNVLMWCPKTRRWSEKSFPRDKSLSCSQFMKRKKEKKIWRIKLTKYIWLRESSESILNISNLEDVKIWCYPESKAGVDGGLIQRQPKWSNCEMNIYRIKLNL